MAVNANHGPSGCGDAHALPANAVRMSAAQTIATLRRDLIPEIL
jgi:hypothetical protein